MILLTRLGGPEFALNPDLIERAEATPDTVITLVGGNKYVVRESLDEVVELITRDRAEIIAAAERLGAPTRSATDAAARNQRFAAQSRDVVPLSAGGLMDPALAIGVGATLVAIFGSIILEGGNPAAIILIPSLVLVFGGTLGAAIAGGVMRDVKALPKQMIRAATAKTTAPDSLVEMLVHLADRARREGILALEDEVAGVEDPFLQRGLQMAVDGIDPEEVGQILGAEIDTKRAADKAAAKLFGDMGGYAPTIGIIGTVLGLVRVLGHLSEPTKLGGEIAGAFVATLWGVMSANVFWLPLSNRLRRISELECEQMELTIEGVLAIQAGADPRLLAQKLQSLLPADEAKKEVA